MKRWHLTEQPFTDGLTQAVFEYLSAKGDRSTLTGYSAHPSSARADLAEALDDLARAAGEAARELRGDGEKEPPEQPDPNKPRSLTVEEVREQFLNHVVAMAKYWSEQPKNSELERCLGLAHSLLAAISGRAMSLPGFDLVCSPHPDDEQYHRDNGENWFPAEDINDGDLNRHLYWRPDGSRRPGTEGDANQEQPEPGALAPDTELAEKDQRIRVLEGVAQKWESDCYREGQLVKDTLANLAHAVEALEFYANELHYRNMSGPATSLVDRDIGTFARTVLQALKGSAASDG